MWVFTHISTIHPYVHICVARNVSGLCVCVSVFVYSNNAFEPALNANANTKREMNNDEMKRTKENTPTKIQIHRAIYQPDYVLLVVLCCVDDVFVLFSGCCCCCCYIAEQQVDLRCARYKPFSKRIVLTIATRYFEFFSVVFFFLDFEFVAARMPIFIITHLKLMCISEDFSWKISIEISV